MDKTPFVKLFGIVLFMLNFVRRCDMLQIRKVQEMEVSQWFENTGTIR
nr:MAG TPA: hypothetical protein [Bacteriophage sp.]